MIMLFMCISVLNCSVRADFASGRVGASHDAIRNRFSGRFFAGHLRQLMCAGGDLHRTKSFQVKRTSHEKLFQNQALYS